MHKARMVALLATLASGWMKTEAVQAGFIDERLPAPSPRYAESKPQQAAQPLMRGETVAGPRVLQVGRRPAKVARVRGTGRSISLSEMMPAVVPRDFRLEMGDAARQQTVSWTGGEPWDRVLMNALAPLRHLQLMIDWDSKRVALRQMMPRSANRESTPSSQSHWAVRASDVTLRQALMRWAKQAGWQIAWEISYDYPVQLEGAFAGTFEEAVEQLMQSLRDSDYPALACLYEANHVVRVLHYGDKKQCA